MHSVIGIDLGGTQVRAIRCDPRGTILAHARADTAATEGPRAVVHQIVQLIEQVRGDVPNEMVLGIGVGTPGPVDGRTGVIYEAPNLKGWIDVPLKQMLHDATGLPVVVGNDANVAALGEWHFGSGHGTNDFIYVTISTGIGGGVIADRNLLLGRKGIAGEVGHVVVQVDGPRCGCGNLGCWEALASGTALARRATEAIEAGEPTILRGAYAEGSISAVHVALAAAANDPLASRLMEREGELIGIGLANLLHLFSPEVIALGGGVMKSADRLLPAIHRMIAEYAMSPYQDARIELATLGDRTGVLGAAALILVPYQSAAHHASGAL
jgi:glucokinase